MSATAFRICHGAIAQVTIEYTCVVFDVIVRVKVRLYP
jgi:hypothetical protein